MKKNLWNFLTKRGDAYFFIIAFFFGCNLFSQDMQTSQRKIAITMDDLPLQRIDFFSPEQGTNIFNKLIEQIKSQRVPVIGFVNESKLIVDSAYNEDRVDLLKNWLNAGFDLGNHTFSHRSANVIPLKDYEDDILKGERVIRKLTEAEGKELKYFRHPFLHTGLSLETRDEIESFLKQHGYKVAPVTIDNAEWIFGAAYDKAAKTDSLELMKEIGDEYIKYMNAKLVYYEGRSQELFGRNIAHVLLIHANRLNSDYFGKLCEMMRGLGYKFTMLEEALKDEAYKTKDAFVKNNGISWIGRWALTAGKKKDFFAGEPRTPAYIMKIAELESE